MKLKSKWPVRRFFAFLGALYLFLRGNAAAVCGERHGKKRICFFAFYDTATETVRTVNDLDFLCGGAAV